MLKLSNWINKVFLITLGNKNTLYCNLSEGALHFKKLSIGLLIFFKIEDQQEAAAIKIQALKLQELSQFKTNKDICDVIYKHCNGKDF